MELVTISLIVTAVGLFIVVVGLTLRLLDKYTENITDLTEDDSWRET